jgi:hypothetical protein
MALGIRDYEVIINQEKTGLTGPRLDDALLELSSASQFFEVESGDIKTINPALNYNFQNGGLKDTYVTVPVTLGDSVNTSWYSSLGSINSIIGNINQVARRSEIVNASSSNGGTLTITSDGTDITASFESAEGADITFYFSDGETTVDTTTPLSVAVPPGTDTVPLETYLYILASDPTTLVANTSFPSDSTTEYYPVGIVTCQSASTVQTYGVLKQHNYTDHIKADGGNGHLHDTNERLRKEHAIYDDGVIQSITGSGSSSITYGTTAGKVFQLHEQDFPAFTSPASLVCINDPDANYRYVVNLASLLKDSTGSSLTNRYYSIVIWGVCSQSGSGQSKLMVNLPSGSYNSLSNAIADSDKHTNYSIPLGYRGTGFLIQRIVLKNNGDSTWDVEDTDDLRGRDPDTQAGSSIATPTEFIDSVFRILDNADTTKELAFELSGFTSGNTRTISFLDKSYTPADDALVAHLAGTETFSGSKTFEAFTGFGTDDPKERVHVLGSGSNTRLEVETNTSNDAALKMTTPAATFGWYADGSSNWIYLYDYGGGGDVLGVQGSSGDVHIYNDLFLYGLPSGATQELAGASQHEFWKTSGHATLPDNVVMIGV